MKNHWDWNIRLEYYENNGYDNTAYHDPHYKIRKNYLEIKQDLTLIEEYQLEQYKLYDSYEKNDNVAMYVGETDILKLKYNISLDTLQNILFGYKSYCKQLDYKEEDTYSTETTIDKSNKKYKELLNGDMVIKSISKSKHMKCVRCWHYCITIGKYLEHPELCERCMTNIFGLGEVREFA